MGVLTLVKFLFMAVLTTSNGNPVDDNQHSITAGPHGPILLSDFHLIDKISHFDRERIPERVVHAKGAGAHGYFEVTNSALARSLCKSRFLARDGKRTPVLVRFSTVGGEKGSADSERDPRGFAVKFYTEEGNWDMVGNNTPVFFIRDPIKFPDFIHTQKRNPQSNLKDPDAFWDFLSLVPESIHQVSILFSDRGTPKGYRFMNGYSSHTLKLVNSDGKISFVKWHFKTDQGIKNFTGEEAGRLAGSDPDWSTRDLFGAISRKEFPSWTVYVQVMNEEQARAALNSSHGNLLQDVTKVWPHAQFPLQPLGRMVLNKNPENYFAEIEQVAFSPGHLIPGIEASNDKMLQGRLFSYPDTHRHRLGPNYQQIPVNKSIGKGVFNQQRDGLMQVNGNGGSAPNHEPNTIAVGAFGTSSDPKAAEHEFEVSGRAGRHKVLLGDCDFIQAGRLYEIQSSEGKTRMVGNIVGHLSGAKPHIRARQLVHFKRANQEMGKRIEQGIISRQSNRL